jgi:hypothetical protein
VKCAPESIVSKLQTELLKAVDINSSQGASLTDVAPLAIKEEALLRVAPGRLAWSLVAVRETLAGALEVACRSRAAIKTVRINRIDCFLHLSSLDID